MISSLSAPEQHSESDGSTHLPPRRTRRRWHQYKSSTPRTENPRIWVQLGCNKTSREFLRAPRVAIGAVKLQTVTSGRWTVTAEVASSSLVVPAILSMSQAAHQVDFRLGTKRHTIGTGDRLSSNRAYVSCALSRNKSATTASWALRFSVVTACV
jgi:hypothetical protein